MKIKKHIRLIFSLLVITILIMIVIFYSNKEKVEVFNFMTYDNWGLSFQEEGKPPKIDVNEEILKQCDAYYLGDKEKKKIYLTFDAGYENGNTEKILDILKEHDIKATFFLVGNYLETCPEIVKRMVEDGHIVGNHTYHHKDMSKLNSKESFMNELLELEKLYEEITGAKMQKYYRPPQGKYSQEQLVWAQEAGYKSCFWSLAYVDWDEKNQPSNEEAMEKLTKRIHPGAIVLLHSTSTTNSEILGDVIKEWKNMGYTFGNLDEL